MSTVWFDRPSDTLLTALSANISEESLVSVVMTCFNSSEWLESAVQSILEQQGWSRFELIVVDDASTDQCTSILKCLASIDRRVRPFFLRRNVGTYRAKNVGMSISHGDLITFMDSDDISAPARISEQARLQVERNLVATTCNYIRADEEGNILRMGGTIERQALVSLMFKRQVIADIGWFDSVRTSADDEFFERIRVVYGRDTHQNVPRPLYRALHRTQSLSTDPRAPVHVEAESFNHMLSPPRQQYVDAYRRWHADAKQRGRIPYMPYNILSPRPFPAPPEISSSINIEASHELRGNPRSGLLHS